MYYKREKELPPMPNWMKWSMILFIAYLGIFGYRSEEASKEDPQSGGPTLKDYPAITTFGDVDRWRRIANPGYNRDIEYEDLSEGSGEYAACGQAVTLKVEMLAPKDKLGSTELNPPEAVRFTVGQGGVYEAWDRGVLGMYPGGKRMIQAGARLINPDSTELDEPPYVFMLELLSATPHNGDRTPYFSMDVVRDGIGVPLSCGKLGLFLISIRSSDGAPRYETPSIPVPLRLGYSELGHGLDRGLVGIKIGEVRRMVVPSYFFPENSPIPFPDGEMAIVEVMRVSYKEDELVLPNSKDAHHEPDSQTPERDSTLPDDGGNRQGSGAESSR